MQLEKLIRRRRKPLSFFLVVGIAMFLLGMVAAYAKKQVTAVHLPPPQSGSVAAKMDSIAAQWIYASQLETEEGWQSVLDFDDSEVGQSIWKYKALQQLALLYISKEETEKAYEIFLTFAEFPDYDPHARAFGYAGLSWYYAKQGYPSMAKVHLGHFSLIASSIRGYDEPTYKILGEATQLTQSREEERE